jgi:hypothetical protein
MRTQPNSFNAKPSSHAVSERSRKLPARVAGAIDEYVAALTALAHRGGDRFAAGKLAQIGRNRHRFGRAGSDLRDRLRGGGEVCRRGRRQQNLRALARKGRRDAAADTAAAAGDDYDFSVELGHAVALPIEERSAGIERWHGA